ncbi:hypothetical protein FYK55_14095 [Roseiconus nitratireducens]|uniref:Cohesin domain-containing protein n=1 Tax=Roseiconus nitratireducens TaxID=2605748 RepID=A0A5M6D842_9BACT|nr:cohesin domain-containing protein [Roseiconus nitratireducens]KAA5542660.1 hypothetical protein FYK55_14095 [Roseiconus nitratireducens]
MGNRVDIELVAPEVEPKVGDDFSVELQIRSSATDSLNQIPEINVFQAKVDLFFNPDVVRPVMQGVTISDGFRPSVPRSDQEPGVIRNFGVISSYYDAADAISLDADGTPFRVALISFRVVGTGDAAITLGATGDGESILLFGSNTPLPTEQVQFSSFELAVGTPPILNWLPRIDTHPIPAVTDDRLDLGYFLLINSFSTNFSVEHLRANLPFITLGVIGVGLDVPDAGLEIDELLDPFLRTPEVFDSIPPGSDEPDDSESDLQAEQIRDSPLADVWNDFDLQLLNDRPELSLLRLHLRKFRLMLENCSAEADNAAMALKRAESIVDLGWIDISPWLTDPAFQHWNEPVPRDRPDAPSPSVNGRSEAKPSWLPRGKTFRPPRLDLFEEIAKGIVPGNLRKPNGGRVDMKDRVPASNNGDSPANPNGE